MEQDAGGVLALNSQFPLVKADKLKTANVPHKMRPLEIYSSLRLSAPIRCVCQPGSLLENQDKALLRPQRPGKWMGARERKRGGFLCFFLRQVAELTSLPADTAAELLQVKVRVTLLEQRFLMQPWKEIEKSSQSESGRQIGGGEPGKWNCRERVINLWHVIIMNNNISDS